MKVIFKAVVLATAIAAFAFVLNTRHAGWQEASANPGAEGSGPGGP